MMTMMTKDVKAITLMFKIMYQFSRSSLESILDCLTMKEKVYAKHPNMVMMGLSRMIQITTKEHN